MSPPRHSSPLPRLFHIFTGITLHQYFVGWMAKIGKTFGGFMESMHKIGINKILISSWACVLYRIIVNIKRLCLGRLCIIPILMAILTSNTTASRDKSWCIEENDSSINIDWVDAHKFFHTTSTSIPIEDSYFFTSISTYEINSLLLHNVTTYIDTDSSFHSLANQLSLGPTTTLPTIFVHYLTYLWACVYPQKPAQQEW